MKISTTWLAPAEFRSRLLEPEKFFLFDWHAARALLRVGPLHLIYNFSRHRVTNRLPRFVWVLCWNAKRAQQ